MAVDTPKVVGAIAFYFTVSISLVFLNKARAAAGQSQAPTPRDDTGSRAHRSSSPVAPASMRRFSSRGTNAWCVGPAAPLRWRAARGRDAARHPPRPCPQVSVGCCFVLGELGREFKQLSFFPRFSYDLEVARRVMPVSAIFVSMMTFNKCAAARRTPTGPLRACPTPESPPPAACASSTLRCTSTK